MSNILNTKRRIEISNCNLQKTYLESSKGSSSIFNYTLGLVAGKLRRIVRVNSKFQTEFKNQNPKTSNDSSSFIDSFNTVTRTISSNLSSFLNDFKTKTKNENKMNKPCSSLSDISNLIILPEKKLNSFTEDELELIVGNYYKIEEIHKVI